MNNTRRLNAILWTGNVLLIIGIVAFAFQVLMFAEHRTDAPASPVSLTVCPKASDRADVTALSELRNPLRLEKNLPLGYLVLLIGIDRILDDPAGITAYLELPARKLNVNAYLAEPVRDSTGQEIAELSGWLLKKVTPKSAVFTTPDGEVTLQLQEITASSASSKAVPTRDTRLSTSQDDVRTALNEAAELYRQGRLAESGVKFEEAFRMRPSSDTVYALIQRVGADVVATMMTSEDEKIRNFGYRLFEVGTPRHERIRSGKAVGHLPPSRTL